MPDNSLDHVFGRVRDATRLNWVDRFAPAPWRPYLRLSRADRPIGTWLLLIPCFWGVLLAANHSGWRMLDIWLLLGSAIGAFLMRGAGCTWNDLLDADIDAQVERTRSRPIPSGQVSTRNAFLWLLFQAVTAFLILLSFNGTAIWVGIASLLPVAIYPMAKRFTWWPQVFLGIAFNWGALLLWAAHTGTISLPAIYLYVAGIAWTLHYDTIYAHQDRDDDALIGVKSTARLFGDETKFYLMAFTGAFLFTGMLGVVLVGGLPSILGVLAMAGFMHWQTLQLKIDDPEACLAQFRNSRWGGWLLCIGIALDLFY